jgi:hypothetical protein
MNILSLISLLIYFLIAQKERNVLEIRQKSWQLPQQGYNIKRVLKIFLLQYFEYRQIYLNVLMDDCHDVQYQKFGKKKKKKKHCEFLLPTLVPNLGR